MESREHLLCYGLLISENVAAAVSARADDFPVLCEYRVIVHKEQSAVSLEVCKTGDIQCEFTGHKNIICSVLYIYSQIYVIALAVLIIDRIRVLGISRVVALTPCDGGGILLRLIGHCLCESADSLHYGTASQHHSKAQDHRNKS